MEEKEKQIIHLRQQELARLRKGKERPQSAPLGSYFAGATDGYSQEHISSRPNSDMYSIPEQSFEGTSSFRQSDHNEVESASDKENNIYSSQDQYLSSYQTHRNDEGLNDIETNDFKYNPEDRYLSEVIDSRPISAHSKKYTSNPDRRKSDLYVRHEFQKQFEVAFFDYVVMQMMLLLICIE